LDKLKKVGIPPLKINILDVFGNITAHLGFPGKFLENVPIHKSYGHHWKK
jgi:hypothetical protein